MKVKTRNIFIDVILFFLVFIFYSCNKNQKTEELNFINDSTKIGIETIDYDLGIKFNPPKDWELQPASLSKKMESNSSESFYYQPIYLFFDNESKAILSVGKVQSSDTSLSKTSQINYYKSLITNKYKNNNIVYTSFTKGKIHFYKINYEKENFISYKIIFQNESNEIIQFDYSFNKNIRDKIFPFMQASIGTIETIKK